MSEKARVFISFVHEDKDVAEAVQRLLSSTLNFDREVFLSSDETHVLAGDVWLDKIRNALESCEILLLLPHGAHYLLTSIHRHLGLETDPPLTQWEQRDQHRRLYERDGRTMTDEEKFRIDLLDPYKEFERALSTWSDVDS